MSKIVLRLMLLLGLLVLPAGCAGEKITDIPDIRVSFVATELTDAEYVYVGTKELENVTKNDFKKMMFSLDVIDSSKITDRQVIVLQLKHAANAYDGKRYWFGKGYRQDNPGEHAAHYSDEFVFYAKGLDEQAIRNIFRTSEAMVSWTTSDGERRDKTFLLGDVLKFE
ncbi:hypothetical protein GTO91_17580 [Heliobacterium undosum]|uniref:Uncharacterized protein n=1 Tax=Heliomicrobium undosum TaxID=121734 RepID=A0A845L5B4_9FIRM|nr:hypothetical protein [Heliomicrobium undosum]MZP31493.1 hypothetical protein [Heliomicrobium undosum]